MTATREPAARRSADLTRPIPPRGVAERLLRWTSTALVLGTGIALLVFPPSNAASVEDPDAQLVRIGAGAGLIFLLIFREMFCWFGSRRS